MLLKLFMNNVWQDTLPLGLWSVYNIRINARTQSFPAEHYPEHHTISAFFPYCILMPPLPQKRSVNACMRTSRPPSSNAPWSISDDHIPVVGITSCTSCPCHWLTGCLLLIQIWLLLTSAYWEQPKNNVSDAPSQLSPIFLCL